MEILYCDKCGNRIPEADLERGDAIRTDSGAYCAKCAPEAPAPAERRPSPPGTRSLARGHQASGSGKYRRPTTALDTRATAAAGSGRSPTQRRELENEPTRGMPRGGTRKPNMALLAVIGVGAGFLIVAAALMLLRGGKERGTAGQPRQGEQPKAQAPPRAVPEERQAPQEKPKPKPPKDEPKQLGLQAMETPPKEAPPKAGPPPKCAPRASDCVVYFLERPDENLTPWQLACKKGEAWLLDPKGEPPKRVVLAPAVAKPPVIDGSLDDGCWKDAGVLRDFVVGEHNTAPENPPALEKITGYACHNGKVLFLGFRADDQDIPGLVRKGTETKQSLWDDDSFELFLDFDRDYSAYRQIIINVDGAHTEGTGTSKLPDTPGMDVKTKVNGDHWILEIALPLSELAPGTKPGVVWGMNVVKNGYVDGKYYSSSWTHLKNGTNHAPLEFGYLIFK